MRISPPSTFRPTVPPELTVPERVLRRDRRIVGSALGLATALAWAWLAGGMGMNMAAPFSAAYLGATVLMWALMMVAMMTPSAAPMFLLHARVARVSFGRSADPGIAGFILAYVLVWTVFSGAAAALQASLVAAGHVGAMSLSFASPQASGAVLVMAGLYQFSPLKQSCLDRCRSPLSFLARGVRPGFVPAFRLGLAHGLYCLGCCWALMLLLFAGGVMNLAWIALLALAVTVEKLGPWTVTRPVVAALLIVGGLALLSGIL